jgi:hypothetical protein
MTKYTISQMSRLQLSCKSGKIEEVEVRVYFSLGKNKVTIDPGEAVNLSSKMEAENFLNLIEIIGFEVYAFPESIKR